MPRPIRPWFRVYVEMISDRKIRRLTPTQRWVWVAVMAAARESPVPGTLLIAEGMPMTVDELAAFADVKPREVNAALSSMQSLGMVSVQDGTIVVCNWSARQFESDVVTERTKKHRSAGLGTPLEQSLERSYVVPGNGPEAETETDKEKTLESEIPKQIPKPRFPSSTSDPGFAAFWLVYPRKVAKPDAFKRYVAALKSGATVEEILAGAQRYAAANRAAEERFIAHPATWLNQGRWTDEAPKQSTNAAAGGGW